MSLVLNKTITVYNFTGEVNYRAEYQATTIRDVYTTTNAGVEAGGTTPDDTFVAYIFDTTSKADGGRTFLPPHEWDALSDKSGHWTLHDDGRDIIAPGEASNVSKPIENPEARKVIKVYRPKAGRPQLWHRKVVAK